MHLIVEIFKFKITKNIARKDIIQMQNISKEIQKYEMFEQRHFKVLIKPL